MPFRALAGRSDPIVMMNSKVLFSHIKYAADTLLLRKPRSYMIGMIITDRCNLNCIHCLGRNKGLIHSSYKEIAVEMKRAYARGNRYIYFSGGEPHCWEDGDHNFHDLIKLAKTIGYFDIFVATNGTFPLTMKDCLYYISIDGPVDIHNQIRCGSYNTVMTNIDNSLSGRNYVTFTVTKKNFKFIEEFAREISAISKIKGIYINFFTGDDEQVNAYGLTRCEKESAINTIIRLKREGLPFEISYSALESIRRNNWKRPLSAVEVFLNGKIYSCCRHHGNDEVCKNCGFGETVEISQIMRLRPDAVMRLFKT